MKEDLILAPQSTEVSGSPEKKQEKVAGDNFKIWNDALLTRKPEAVAALYSDEATFLPTVSPDYKRGKKGALDYMGHFLQKSPEGTIISAKTIFLNDNCYAHVGKYNFAVGPIGKRENVSADFTYVWQKNEKDAWGIIHHHSSAEVSSETTEFLNEHHEGEIIIEEKQPIDQNHLLLSGIYNIPDGDKVIKARFTRLLVKEQDKWQVMHQHLSLLPGVTK